MAHNNNVLSAWLAAAITNANWEAAGLKGKEQKAEGEKIWKLRSSNWPT